MERHALPTGAQHRTHADAHTHHTSTDPHTPQPVTHVRSAPEGAPSDVPCCSYGYTCKGYTCSCFKATHTIHPHPGA
eukprot:1903005-Prymnesium_polylepis.1